MILEKGDRPSSLKVGLKVGSRAKLTVGLKVGLAGILGAIALFPQMPAVLAQSSPTRPISQSTYPPPTAAETDIPEEILRTEIITEARSPLNGEPLSAAEYAQLQAELASPAGESLVNPEIRYLVFLLQLRNAVKPILPFL